MGQLIALDDAGRLILPDGQGWTTPPGQEHIPLERIVPRVCMVPDSYAFSSGQECIELAAMAGLELDPWQQLNIILGLGETSAGKWAAFLVALIVARQNGKGSELEALELYWLFLRGERLIGHSAHEYKTAMEAFRRILFLIENNDWLRKKVKKVINTNGEEGIELITGQRLRFMARSKGAGRGFTFHKLVWDEAYALTREQQDAQLPTMSAVPNPQIWITSSPPLTSDTGPVLFQTRRLARLLGDQLVFMDYGADGSLDKLDLIDLDDVEVWKRSNPSEVHVGSGHGVSVETMKRERSSMSDEGFARERLCIWPPDLTQGFGVITQEQWDAMKDERSGSEESEETKLTGKPIISISVSPRGSGSSRTAIGLCSARQDGKRHIELIASDKGTSWSVEFLKHLLLANDIGAIVIDPGSPTGSLLAQIENLLTEMGLSSDLLLKMTSRDVAAAFGMLYDAATGSEVTIVHLGQAELDLAIGGAVTRTVGTDGLTWDSMKSTCDVTGLIAVTNVIWGLFRAKDIDINSTPMVVWA